MDAKWHIQLTYPGYPAKRVEPFWQDTTDIRCNASLSTVNTPTFDCNESRKFLWRMEVRNMSSTEKLCQ